MTKPTKSLKNSFIFLETIFALLLLSSAIAIFINLPLHKHSTEPAIQTIENQFLQRQYDSHFSHTSQTLIFTKNETETLEFNINKISYETSQIKLHAYEF